MRGACHIAYTQNIVPRVVDDDTKKVGAIISPADDDSLWLRKGGIDEALPFIDRFFLAQRIGQLDEGITLTPLLKLAANGVAIRIVSRHQVPLPPGGANPQYHLPLSCPQ